MHPSQLGSTSLSVDPKLGKTFKVDYGASHFVLEALGPVKHEGPATRYLQRGGICQATSTATFTLSCQGSCLLLIGTISVSFTVTEPFSLLRPRHCVDVSLLLVVAVGIRCHTGGWHIVHEAPRLATCPPNARYCPRQLLCSSVEKATALCGESLMHHVCECVTRSESFGGLTSPHPCVHEKFC